MNLTAFVPYRWLRRLAWSLGALFALGALAWVVLPPLAKTQAQIRLSALLGRQVTIGSLAFSPWSLQLSVHDFAVATADGKGVQFSVDRLYVDAQARSLLQGVPVIETLTVDAPQLQLTRLGEGHYDIDDIVQRLNQADDSLSAPTPKFALYNLTLNHGSLDFADRADGAMRLHTLRDLALSLGFLSNLDSKRDAMVSPRLSFVLNGSRFESQASVNPFGQSPKAQAHIKISQLDIAPYLAYLPPDLPVQARSAIMDADLSLDFLHKPQTALTLSGSLMVRQLALQDLQGKLLFSADQLQIGLLDLRPLERSARLSTMDVNAPVLHLARSAAGQLNFLPLGPAKHNATKKASADAASAQAGAGVINQTAAKPAWVLQLDTLTLQDASVDWTDLATAPVTRLGLRDLQVTVAKLQWPMQSAATLDLKTRLQSLAALSAAPTAQLSLQGQGTWDAGKVQAELSDFDLALVSGYISPYLEPSLRGQASTRFNLAWDGERQSALVQTLALRDVALVDGKAATLPRANAAVKNKGPSSADLPQWKLLELSDLRIENQARTAYLGKVTLQKPSAGVRRDAAGHWMFEDWLKAAKPGAAALATQAAGKEQAGTQRDAPKAPVPWKLQVGQFNLEDGSLVFLDRVPARPVRLEISGLQVQAKNMQPQGNTPMPLQLAAKVKSGQAEAGKLRYTGILLWDPLVVQGAMDMSDFPAHALATYALGGMNFVVLRADTSFQGQVYYAERAQGPELSLKGDAALEDFKANTAGKGAASLDEELLSWKALNLPGIDLRMAPGLATQVQVGGAALSDFYARLILSPQGRLNLQELGQSTPALAHAALLKSNSDASPVPSATSGITSNATQARRPIFRWALSPWSMVGCCSPIASFIPITPPTSRTWPADSAASPTSLKGGWCRWPTWSCAAARRALRPWKSEANSTRWRNQWHWISLGLRAIWSCHPCRPMLLNTRAMALSAAN